MTTLNLAGCCTPPCTLRDAMGCNAPLHVHSLCPAPFLPRGRTAAKVATKAIERVIEAYTSGLPFLKGMCFILEPGYQLIIDNNLLHSGGLGRHATVDGGGPILSGPFDFRALLMYTDIQFLALFLCALRGT